MLIRSEWARQLRGMIADELPGSCNAIARELLRVYVSKRMDIALLEPIFAENGYDQKIATRIALWIRRNPYPAEQSGIGHSNYAPADLGIDTPDPT